MACHYHSAPSRPAVPLHLQLHAHTHTHPASCVSSHILYSSTLTLSPTLSVCSLSNSHPDEWEGKTERETKSGWVGWRDWKWKTKKGKTCGGMCTFAPGRHTFAWLHESMQAFFTYPGRWGLHAWTAGFVTALLGAVVWQSFELP